MGGASTVNTTIAVRLGLGLALLLSSLAGQALAADLQALNVASLPGDRIELKLTFDQPVPVPKGYTIEQPARIALDLPGVANKLGTKSRELGNGNARSVTVVEAGNRTPPDHQPHQSGQLRHPGRRSQPVRHHRGHRRSPDRQRPGQPDAQPAARRCADHRDRAVVRSLARRRSPARRCRRPRPPLPWRP